MIKPNYRRLDIWYVRLDPTEGREAQKTRPCLVLQNDVGNEFSEVTIVAPFLEPKEYPFVVNVKPSSTNGLDRVRGLNLSQMRVVSYTRFVSQLGVLESHYKNQIDRAVSIELSLFDS